MADAPAELAVIALAYDFLVWGARHVARFPRAHRYAAGARFEQLAQGVVDQLLRAKYTRDRAPVLRAINLKLEILRFHIRLLKDLQCLSKESYGHAARTVNEFGRMVGGWMKSGRPPEPPAEGSP